MDLKDSADRHRIHRNDLQYLLEKKHSLMGDFLEATRIAVGLCDDGLENLDATELTRLLEHRDECIGKIDGIDREVIHLGPNPGELSRSEWEEILGLLDSIQSRALQAAFLSETVQSSLELACRRFQGRQATGSRIFAQGGLAYSSGAVRTQTPRFLNTRS